MRILFLLQVITATGSVCGIGFYLLSIWSARSYLSRQGEPTSQTAHPPFYPPVSILKPLRGADSHLYESFRSHCLQDFSQYEIIFGVSEPDDPAIAVVERIKQEFPNLSIQLIVCAQNLGANTKVSNLIQMLPFARYEHILVNDSDIRVPPDYLRRIVAPFSNPQVGMVTCFYRGAAGKSLGSRLESIGIGSEFIPGVLTARQLEGGMHFALGSTLAMTRRSLAAIGGFEALADYLADDYELGCRIAAAGFAVVLSDVVVDTFVPEYSLRSFFNHQFRWGRSTRDSRRWGYLGVLLTFGLPWSVLALIFSRGAIWACALFGTALLLRLTVAIVIGSGVLRDRQIIRQLWLVPLRDLAALMIWIGSYTGHTITWRGKRFVLKDRKLHPVG
jgi:ceramide glucosyltransferase